MRTCFRLRSPEQREDDEWAVEFLLQAVDEPSVLVPAHQVWFADDGVLRRWIPAPQEHLLADLGRASKLHPELDEALRGSHPAEMEVDAEGAYRFLTAAPVLAQAGFGVLLPSWWQQTTKLGLKLTTKSRGTAGTVAKESEIGLKSIVDYKWELALGEDTLTDAELAELARAKVPLVKVRGQWVQVDQKRLAAGLAFLKRGGGQMTAAEVMLHSGLTEEDESLPLPLMSVEADGWLGDLLSGKADEQIEPVEPPENFLAQLRPYQQRGLAWLAFLDKIGLGACLADDMGLGKTVQLLALEALNRSHGKRPPTLLICPMSVVGNWQREAARFTPELSVHVHHGADRLGGDALREAVESNDLILTTYALAARDADALSDLAFDRVVLDEAQNIKNSATRQSQAVRQIKARHRVALTGTPVENRLAELWSIMDFANPGVLGTVNTFRARFAVPVERHNDQGAAARLRKITNPFVLRRVKTDPRIISDLPDKVEMRQLCNLTTEQASLYQAVVNDMLEKIEEAEGIGRKGLVLATMSKLKQVCNHPAHFLGDGSRVMRPLRQARAPGGGARGSARRGRQGVVLHAVHRVRQHARALPGRALRHRGDVPARRHEQGLPRPHGRALPGQERPVAVPVVAQGRRHRPQPHRRQPRDPPGPLVEPGRRGPGDRPRVPHRPAPQRAGAQVRLHRHAGRTHRRHDRGEARPGPAGGRRRMRTGSPTCPPHSCGTC